MPDKQEVLDQNAGFLSIDKIRDELEEETIKVGKDNIFTNYLNVLVDKNTGKIEKIGTTLHETDNENLLNIYVSVTRHFTDASVLKLALVPESELSKSAAEVLSATLEGVKAA